MPYFYDYFILCWNLKNLRFVWRFVCMYDTLPETNKVYLITALKWLNNI